MIPGNICSSSRRRPWVVRRRRACTKYDRTLTTTDKRAVSFHGKIAAMKTQASPAQLEKAQVHFNKILVPCDFSPASHYALEFAIGMAQKCGGELTLVHVVEPEPAWDGQVSSNGAGVAPSEPTRKTLRAWSTFAKVQDVRAGSTVRHGLAVHEILETAKELEVDLIVIAAHGETGWKHFCIGSTAERVVRGAPCPVMVVRQKEHEFA